MTIKMIRNYDWLVSRLVAYIAHCIVVSRREDLEPDDISTIWIETGLPHQWKFLVCGVYRKWSHLKVWGEIGHEGAERSRKRDGFFR